MKNKIYIVLAVFLGTLLVIQTAYIISLERNQRIFMVKQRMLQQMPYFRLQDRFVAKPRIPQLNTYFTMQEMPKEYLVTMFLPNLSKEEIKVELKDAYLTISGAKKMKEEKAGKNYQSQQMAATSFLQVIRLPEGAWKKEISSEYKDDNLIVHIPRKPEEKKKK